MLKHTVLLICSNCGVQFKYELNDAIKPIDMQMLRHPMCRKCRTFEKLKKVFCKSSKGSCIRTLKQFAHNNNEYE